MTSTSRKRAMMAIAAMAMLWLASVAAWAAQGAGTRVEGPVLGYVYEAQSQRLRAIRGIPGAAMMGPQVEVGASLHDAVMAYPSGREPFALALTGDEQRVSVLDTAGSVRELTEAGRQPDLMAISPRGSAAALYFASRGKVQVISGLPEASAVFYEAAVAIAGDLQSLAISDDGEALVAAAGGAVYLLPRQGASRLLASTGARARVSFIPGRSDLLIADESADQVLLVAGVTGSAASRVLASGTPAVAGPVAVAASADGRQVFIANARNSTVSAIEVSTGAAAVTVCECEVTQLARMDASGSVFGITAPGSGPLRLYQASSSGAKVFFVPADAPPVRAEDAGGDRVARPDRRSGR
jgi:DNA-binding beta-propeller fold protein YncE